MHDRIAGGRPACEARIALLLLLGIAMGGCGAGLEHTMTFFADPSKYQFYTCDELAKAATGLTNRQKELQALMDKAEQGAGGALASIVAYRTDYITASEELRVIETTARSNNCLVSSTWRSNDAIQ